MKNNSPFHLTFGWTIIIVICLIPVFLLLLNSPNLNNYANITHTLGQIFGLVGMTLFALTFILSSRFKFLETIFGGLDKVYRIHSIIGALAFIFILFHPALLVLKFIPQNISLALAYLLPGGALSVDLGIYALLGMILLMGITFYIKLKYNFWKISHKFMGVFFILAVFHIVLVRGTVSRDNIFPGYYGYVAVVSLIGLIGFIYSLLLRRNVRVAQYRVYSINETNGCYDIILSPIKRPIRYRAGQFAFLKFYGKEMSKESHPFSIASKSNDEKLRFIIKALGDFTSTLNELKAGDKVLVEGPYGRFNRRSKNEQIWIAGGIGITPFLGMAADCINSDRKIDLYYSVKSSLELISIDELIDVSKKNKNFKLIKWVVDDGVGFLNVNEIKKRSSDIKNKEFYLCGPAGMKDALRTALLKEGINKENIIEEDFNFK